MAEDTARTWNELLPRTVTTWTPDVLLVNPVKGAPGTRGTESPVARYIDTVGPSYLYGGFQATFPAEPLYFHMIAGQLRRAGVSCEIADGFCHRFNVDEMLEVVRSFDTKIVAFAVFHNTLDDALACAAAVKAEAPDVKTIVGSAYASPHWRSIVSDEAVDFVVVGDGEVAFTELVAELLAGRTAADVAGVARVCDGEPTLNPPQPIEDLDALAFAARDLMDLIVENGHSASMYTTRGCAFGRCTFCYLLPYQEVALQPRWRARAPEDVVNELEYLTSTFNTHRVTFVDEDYFGSNSDGVQRAIDIAKLILDRGIAVRYYVNALVKSLLFVAREGHLPLLVASGLDSVFTGFESSSREALVAFKKPQRPDQYEELIDTLTAHGVRINPGLITFTPTASLEEIEGNVRLAQRMRYYDLFLFTRRLVDLDASPVDARTSAMTKSLSEAPWRVAYAAEHDAVVASFVDRRVGVLFQMLRILCNLLFEAFDRSANDLGEDTLRMSRDAVIEAHYACFQQAAIGVRSPVAPATFDDALQWAEQAHRIVLSEIRASSNPETAAATEWS